MLDGLPFVPEGTTIPPAPYLVVVLLAAGAVGTAFRRRSPAVTGRHVLALAPWMALGSAAHVLYVVDALPAVFRPFAGSPTVYLTVGVLTGGAWLVADGAMGADGSTAAGGPVAADGSTSANGGSSLTASRVPTALTTVGLLLLGPTVALALTAGISTDGAFWSTVALVTTVPIAAGVWVGLTRLRPETAITGGVGALAVFGHALDGVSTAVGVTHLGFGERTPASRVLLEVGGLPSLPVLGEGWVFLFVKLAVASVVVWLFAEYVRETPSEGYLLLGFVAAVGFGPAVHNLLLFAVVG